MRKISLSFAFFILCSAFAIAEIKLPALVGDNMVLQQKSEVQLWGKANSNSKISVKTSWNNQVYETRSDVSGNWRVVVNTPEAGGPYMIKISDGKEIEVKGVLIGEVWVCSGQSNMEMALRGNSSPVLNADQIILNADNPYISLFKVKSASSIAPLDNVSGQWNSANSASARDFSAIGFQFAQILQKKLKVPIGMIMTTVGGTMVEAWMSKSSLMPFTEVKVPESLDKINKPHREPTALFNAMVAPLTKYKIKGVIWYQGESNRHEPELYAKLFPAMVSDWRKQWNIGDFPFYYAQIAPFSSSDPTRSGPKLREAQLKAMEKIPNSGMAVLLDVGMENDIHPMNKTVPAQRLSYWALAKTYQIDGIGYQGPIYKSMKVQNGKIELSFEKGPYLTSYKKPLASFEIAGDDQVFYPAEATLGGNIVTVWSKDVKNPVAVRYAFKDWVKGDLYNNDGLPASSFRTDNWN